MTITWRNAGPWGAASVTVDLTGLQVDYNFWDHEVRIRSLEAGGRQVVSVSQSGNALTFHMSDYSTEGPFVLGSFVLNWTTPITWQATHVYSVNDAFVQGSTAYTVIFGHTSASSFDANANDGHGHNYYKQLMTLPNGAPLGGSTHQVLAKNSGADSDFVWASSAFPIGGLTRQIVMKDSSSLYNYSWHDAVDLHLTVEELFDVTAGALADKDLFRWNSTGSGTGHWSNTSFASMAFSIDDLGDVSISTPVTSQSLRYNGTTWLNEQLGFTDLDAASVATPLQVRQSAITALASSGATTLNSSAGDIFTATPSGDITITASPYTGHGGGRITLIVTTISTTSRTITFGTNFKAAGNLVTGTVSGKVFTMTFIDDGTTLYEASRTAAM